MLNTDGNLFLDSEIPVIYDFLDIPAPIPTEGSFISGKRESMSKKFLFAIIAAVAADPAFANRVVTSQTYVDNKLAEKVNIAQGTGTNNANVGKTLVVNSQGNLELGTVSADNFVEDSITDGVTNKAPSENAVHDALENKQDTIETEEVTYTDPEDSAVYQLPSLVAYDSTNGVNGDRIGLLDAPIGGGLRFLAYDVDPTNSDYAVYDNYIPTVRAVATALSSLSTLSWSSSLQSPIVNYSTTFSAASDTWPNGKSTSIPRLSILANGLALKQNKIPATGTAPFDQDDGSVLVTTDTAGNVEERFIWTADTYDGASWNPVDNPSITSNAVQRAIPNVGAVYAGLYGKQEKLVANNATTYPNGSLVAYGATSGVPTAKKIVTSLATNGTDIPTDGAVEKAVAHKQNIIKASEWEYRDGTTIPGVVTSSSLEGGVEERMILDKMAAGDKAILYTVNKGYDEDGAAAGITSDIGSKSVSAHDVNNAVPTTEMTIAIAKAAAKVAIPAGTAGDVVTYSGTSGQFGKAEVMSSLDNYDSRVHSNNLVNAGAVVGALNAQNAHTINGAPLSNAASVFYGTSSTDATIKTKEVSIPSITTLSVGTMIIVQPSETSTAAGSSLKLNNFDAYPMRYNNEAITTSTDSIVWSAAYPSIFVFDGTYWRFVARGYDATYTAMTIEDGVAGTSTTSRVMTAYRLKRIIQGTTLAGIDTTATTAVAATDSITTGIGKLQGQVNTKQSKKVCTRWLDNSEHTDANCLLWNLPD